MPQPLAPADVDLSTVLADAHLINPVMTASGCAAAGRELEQFFPVRELGAVVTKSIMRDPRSGRPTPRMAETASGMLNSIGLQGPGIDAFLARDLPWLLQHDARPIVSIAGSTLGEFAELARRVGNTPESPRSRSTSPVRTSRIADWSSPATRSRPRESSRPCDAKRRGACRSSPSSRLT
jgi:hypothetical protein